MLPELKQKTVAAVICASFGAVIVGAPIIPIIGAANYLHSVQLRLWPFCVSGACLGIAAVSVKHRISLAIATTVILSIVTGIMGLVIEYTIGSAPQMPGSPRFTPPRSPTGFSSFWSRHSTVRFMNASPALGADLEQGSLTDGYTGWKQDSGTSVFPGDWTPPGVSC